MCSSAASSWPTRGGAIDIPHLRSADESPANPGQLGLSELGALAHSALPAGESNKGAALAIDDWAASIIGTQEATLGQIEAALLQAALKSANGNVNKAATLLGLSRAHMDYRTKKTQ